MKNLLIVRKLYGLSQAEVAVRLGVSQQTYARYESEKTDKIPFSVLRCFCEFFFVDEKWLSGEDVSDRSNEVARIIGTRVPEAALRLNVPEAFVNAVRNGEVTHSDEFYKKIVGAFGVGSERLATRNDDGTLTTILPEDLVKENYEYKAIIKRQEITIDNLNAYITVLEDKLKRAGLA